MTTDNKIQDKNGTLDTEPFEINCNTIFIVDDDYFMTGFLKVALSEHGIENIVAFENPLDAISQIKNGFIPALVITDFMMPELNGIELLHEIEKINANVPGIIMTSDPSAANSLSPKWEILKKCELTFFLPILEEKIKNIIFSE
jgi:CheY-like chemotaxis protein